MYVYESMREIIFFAELQKVISSAVPGGDMKRPTPSYRSIISDVFDFRILSSVQCFACKTISSTKEVFKDLSLPIPSKDHLNRLYLGPSYADLASSSTSLNSLASSQSQQGWMEWILGWVRKFPSVHVFCLYIVRFLMLSEEERKEENLQSEFCIC